MLTQASREFRKAMDLQQPDWPVTFATQQELIDFARAMLRAGEPASREHALDTLRYSVASRLFMPLRAAVQAGHLKENSDEAA